jgi:hypothetical protein
MIPDVIEASVKYTGCIL